MNLWVQLTLLFAQFLPLADLEMAQIQREKTQNRAQKSYIYDLKMSVNDMFAKIGYSVAKKINFL